MSLPAAVRKLMLTAHIVASVGWLGAVVVFVALSCIALASDDEQTVRGVYLVMEPAAWFVLLPLAVASLVTGLMQSLGTEWGLFRHYWVVFKLGINVASTFFLLMYMATFEAMADAAGDSTADLEAVRSLSPLLHGAAALVLLSTASVLAVYKPRGRTPLARRKPAH